MSSDVKPYIPFLVRKSLKITFHIGAPRTGTTTLQAICAANKEKLAKQGVAYPLVALIHPKKGNAQHNLAFTLKKTYPAFVGLLGRMKKDEAWAELQKYIQDNPSEEHLFLSSEAFSGLSYESVKYIKNQLSHHEISVIYIRREDKDWQRSMSEQQIKRYPFRKKRVKLTGKAADIAKQHLDGWKRHFAVTEIPYSRETTNVIFKHIGVDPTDFKQIKRKNSKISPKVYDLMIRFNKVDMSISQHTAVNEITYRFFSDMGELLDDDPNSSTGGRSDEAIKVKNQKIRELKTQLDIKDGQKNTYIKNLEIQLKNHKERSSRESKELQSIHAAEIKSLKTSLLQLTMKYEMQERENEVIAAELKSIRGSRT